jgi:hypothetical protein
MKILKLEAKFFYKGKQREGQTLPRQYSLFEILHSPLKIL